MTWNEHNGCVGKISGREKTMSLLSTIFTVNQGMRLEGRGLFTKLTFAKCGKIIHCLYWASAGIQNIYTKYRISVHVKNLNQYFIVYWIFPYSYSAFFSATSNAVTYGTSNFYKIRVLCNIRQHTKGTNNTFQFLCCEIHKMMF